MTRLIAAVLAACVVVLSFALAQEARKPAPDATSAASAPDKGLLQQVLDGWASMKTENVRKYYDQAPNEVFYDVAPVKYVGFKQYEAGVQQMFATLGGLKFTLNDDVAVHPAGNLAWTTATVAAVMTDKAGKSTNVDCRWTVIWQKKAGNWVIVHDHFSAPMAMPQP